MDVPAHYQVVFSRLRGVQRKRYGWAAYCPVHETDTRRRHKHSLTLRLSPEQHLWVRCHRGCEFRTIVQALGLRDCDFFPPKRTDARKESPMATGHGNTDYGNIEGEYNYHDEHGKLLFQVVRFAGKQFRQRHMGPDGKWQWGIGDTRRVLYRLPLIAKANRRRRVVIVEGEKDADRLEKLGMLATTNPMGAGKWRDEYADMLAGCHCIILADNDPVDEKLGYSPGLRHAEQVYESLKRTAASLKMVLLPGLPPKGDVSDWLDAGHGRGELAEQINSAPVLFARTAGKPDSQLRGQDGQAGQEPEHEQPAQEAPGQGDSSLQPIATANVVSKTFESDIESGNNDRQIAERSDMRRLANRLADKAEYLTPEDWVLVARGLLDRFAERIGVA